MNPYGVGMNNGRNDDHADYNPVVHNYVEFIICGYLERAKKYGNNISQEDLYDIRDNLNYDGLRDFFPEELQDLVEKHEVLQNDEMREFVSGDNFNNFLSRLKKNYKREVDAKRYPVSLYEPNIRRVNLANNLTSQPLVYTTDKMIQEYTDDESVELNEYSSQGAGIRVPSFNDLTHERAVRDGESPEPLTDQTDDFDEDTILVKGWNGEDGLSQHIGGYFSPSDQATLASFYENEQFSVSRESLEQSVALLQYMRNKGLEFSPQLNDKYKTAINVNLEEHPYRLRVFDGENSRFTGRLYDGYSSYYMSTAFAKKADEVEWYPEDTTIPLKVMLGEIDGDFIKTTANKNASVRNLSGVSDPQKILQIDPEVTHYESVLFTNEDEAKEYIESLIETGNDVFSQYIDVDSLKQAYEFDEFEFEYSHHDDVSDIQRSIINDMRMASDVIDNQVDPALLPFRYFTEDDWTTLMKEDLQTDELAETLMDKARLEHVGSIEEGFNPSFLINHAKEDDKRLRTREALLNAVIVADIDVDSLKGGDFNINRFKELAIQFNADTAVNLDDLESDYLREKLQLIQDTLTAKGVIGSLDGDPDDNKPAVSIDDKGVVRWEGHRRATSQRKGQSVKLDNGLAYETEMISGQIGQLFEPDEYGVLNVEYNSGEKLGFVPGYSGYYLFNQGVDAPIEDRLRLKGYDQHLDESIHRVLSEQVLRPKKPSWGDIPQGLDASSLNNLYHGDVYGKRLDFDYKETMGKYISEEDMVRRLNTLRGKVRFSNQYAINATTHAETRMNDLYLADKTTESEKAYWKAAGEQNIRVLGDDYINIFDLDMTGNGQTQGLSVYLVEGAVVNKDGSVVKSEGYAREDGSIEPDRSALMKSKYFDYKDYDAWIRRQMPANEYMTAKRIDSGAVTVGAFVEGWTMEDGFVVSKDFAERNEILVDEVNEAGEKVSVSRSLQRGDKISDFHGNKGVIGYVVDPDMDMTEAKAQKVDGLVSVFKNNPGLDVIETSESGISRYNPGRYREQMSDAERFDVKDKDGNVVAKKSAARKAFMVTDKDVTTKTNAYSALDFNEGKGAKASSQLTWQANVANADHMMSEIFDGNTRNWAVYREYLITCGLDLGEDGTLKIGYEGHDGELRQYFNTQDYENSADFLNNVTDKGGFLTVPKELGIEMKSGHKTHDIPVLSSSLRQDTTLIDGQLRRNQYNKDYAQIFDAVQSYHRDDMSAEQSKQLVQGAYNRIADDVATRQLDGKNGHLRSKLMGRRLDQSASGVLIPDPRLKIGEYGMDGDMMDSLNVDDGDNVLAMRNPIWTKGGLRSGDIVYDESVHGVSINPMAVKSMDGDFDGDKLQLIRFKSDKAINEVAQKFGQADNMINPASMEPELYYHTNSELKAAEQKAEALGDNSLTELREQALEFAQSDNSRIRQKGLETLNEYSAKAFREYGSMNYVVSLESEEEHLTSIKQLVDNGIKGSESAYNEYETYFKGEKTRQQDLDIQYATGVKTDDTGLAGAISQRLVALGRNSGDMEAITYGTYPVTQGVLQIKKSASQARDTNDILNGSMRQMYNGVKPGTKEDKMTTRSWASEMKKIYDDGLGVNYNPKHVDKMSELMSSNGVSKDIKELMAEKASPMDQVAYSSVPAIDTLVRLAKEERNFFEGEQSQKYVPRALLQGRQNVLVDTQDKELQERIQTSVESGQVKTVEKAPVKESVEQDTADIDL